MPKHIGIMVSSLVFLSGYFLSMLKQVTGLGFVLSQFSSLCLSLVL